jgi:hypothetical protein
MIAAVGQLATQAAQEIIKRIFKGPDSGISGSDITIVRQVIIGGTGGVSIRPRGAAVSDSDETMRLVAQRCIELLAELDGVEIALAVAPDGTRTLSVRRASGNVREEELLRALGRAGGAAGPRHAIPPIAASSLTDGHMEVFVLASDRRLRHRWYWPDPNWSDCSRRERPHLAPLVVARLGLVQRLDFDGHPWRSAGDRDRRRLLR